MHPLRKRVGDHNGDAMSKRVHRRERNQEDSLQSLKDCFWSLKEKVWWRILPIEEDYDDIATGMGLDWEDLLPLLIQNGPLYAQKRSTMNSYLVNHSSWQTFCICFPGSDQSQITTRNSRREKTATKLNKGCCAVQKGG